MTFLEINHGFRCLKKQAAAAASKRAIIAHSINGIRPAREKMPEAAN
ncbi:MAG: hypothetical protein MJA83_19795 [Gammaproteobacteria bacterium]|nr:hypothetical protein [Gammaproteobacteria bacterium]